MSTIEALKKWLEEMIGDMKIGEFTAYAGQICAFKFCLEKIEQLEKVEKSYKWRNSIFREDEVPDGQEKTEEINNEWAREAGKDSAKNSLSNWKPTPGELIEVSNDGEKWEEREFERFKKKGDIIADPDFKYITKFNGKESCPWWKYARPIVKIIISDQTFNLYKETTPLKTPHVPEFDWEEVCDKAVFAHDEEIDQNNQMIGAIGVQLEAITKYLNKQ